MQITGIVSAGADAAQSGLLALNKVSPLMPPGYSAIDDLANEFILESKAFELYAS